MAKSWIGIDPGKKGYISVIDGIDTLFFSISSHTNAEIAAFIESYKGRNCHVVMEDVHAIYGSSAGATFEFGKINGFLVGLLVAHKIPYTLVQPKEWQGKIWTNADKVVHTKRITQKNGKDVMRKEIDTKATSFNAAQRLFPTLDFRKNSRCKNMDDNKVDSLLMAEYARRNNL